MAFIMVTATYPPWKLPELIEVYTSGNTPDYPPFLHTVHHFVVQDGDYKNYGIYECEDDKIKEGIEAITKRFYRYSLIEGYKYKIEPLLDSKEAMKLLGFL